jgi:ABC-type lipoprotein export system ATPase subunit
MSGGECQRVAIARAIVNNPDLLLADEPTGNLDSRTSEQIMETFHELHAGGITVVLVTHEPDIAVQTGRMLHMKDGRIVEDIVVDEARRKQVLARVRGTEPRVTTQEPLAAAEPPAAKLPSEVEHLSRNG